MNRDGSTENGADTGRGRGRKPRLSREMIVAAARSLPPETLTMKAVADTLGVDRKSLNYYVTDRDGLLELIVLDAFECEIRRLDLPPGLDWRTTLRRFTVAIADALVQIGVIVPYARFTGRTGLPVLKVVEQIVQTLLDAGFDALSAGRAMKLLAEVAHTAAREALQANDGPVDAQTLHVIHALDSSTDDDFPLLRSVADTRHSHARVGVQFEFELALIISGLENLLAELRRYDQTHTAPNAEEPRP